MLFLYFYANLIFHVLNHSSNVCMTEHQNARFKMNMHEQKKVCLAPLSVTAHVFIHKPATENHMTFNLRPNVTYPE